MRRGNQILFVSILSGCVDHERRYREKAMFLLGDKKEEGKARLKRRVRQSKPTSGDAELCLWGGSQTTGMAFCPTIHQVV